MIGITEKQWDGPTIVDIAKMNYDSPTRHTLIGDRQPKAALNRISQKNLQFLQTNLQKFFKRKNSKFSTSSQAIRPLSEQCQRDGSQRRNSRPTIGDTAAPQMTRKMHWIFSIHRIRLRPGPDF